MGKYNDKFVESIVATIIEEGYCIMDYNIGTYCLPDTCIDVTKEKCSKCWFKTLESEDSEGAAK